jgi:peptidoglycan/xylan/chitin deacetylase (PgdA/CDA1 family)
VHRRAWRLFRLLNQLRPRRRLRLLLVLVCLGVGFGMVNPARAAAQGAADPVPAALAAGVGAPPRATAPVGTWPPVLPGSARADLPSGIPADDAAPSPPVAAPIDVPAGAALPGAMPEAPDCARLACVALTFDDGPGPSTGRLLDLLARDRAPATFFVIGRQINGNEALLARMMRDGHVVGNHTWSHPDLSRTSPDKTHAQSAATDAAITAATGQRPTVMRPPYGAMSPTVTQLGEAVILWDVDTLDWKYRVSSSVTQRALAGARSGSIVLMHDIHPSTVEAVPAIIAGLRARGFTLVTVPQLLGQVRAGAVYTRR